MRSRLSQKCEINFHPYTQEKQGDVSDDETVAFKSYLLSLGIDDPVTRETHGSGQQYYRELAREVCRVLDAPVKVRSCTQYGL